LLVKAFHKTFLKVFYQHRLVYDLGMEFVAVTRRSTKEEEYGGGDSRRTLEDYIVWTAFSEQL